MNAHVHAAPPPVRQPRARRAGGPCAIVDRMLAKNPADRFATPAEMADALAPYCTGADSAALLKRAASSPPLAPGDESRSRLPSGTNSGRRENKNLPSPSGRGAGGEGRRWKRFAGLLLLLLMAGGFGFALAIILRIHKDGKDTTVELPEGSNTRVSADGQVNVELPKGSNTSQSTKAPPTVAFPNPGAAGNAANPFTTRGQAEETHSAGPLPTVRVTRPVVCDVCDYEEYSGHESKGKISYGLSPGKGRARVSIQEGYGGEERRCARRNCL